MNESSTDVSFSVESKLVVSVLLRMSLFDRLIKAVHSAERKIVPYHSLLVPILMVYEAWNAEVEDIPDTRQVEAKD